MSIVNIMLKNMRESWRKEEVQSKHMRRPMTKLGNF